MAIRSSTEAKLTASHGKKGDAMQGAELRVRLAGFFIGLPDQDIVSTVTRYVQLGVMGRPRSSNEPTGWQPRKVDLVLEEVFE